MKIGFLRIPLTGDLHPMTALGRKMQARHEVTFFGLPDAALIIHSAGLDFVPFGEEERPVGTTPAMYAQNNTEEHLASYFALVENNHPSRHAPSVARRQEWRDDSGKLKYATWCEYEFDELHNWTKRTVWVLSPEIPERTLYETDTRIITYWTK